MTAACLAPLGHCPLTRGSFPEPSGTSNVGGGEGHRDYFSRSLNAPRYACDVLRIKSACVDTNFSTQSELRSLAVSSSSLSTPSNIFSYASSQMRPFSLLNASTRSLVCLIRSAAASTSGVKFGVSGVNIRRSWCLRRGLLGWCLSHLRPPWLVSVVGTTLDGTVAASRTAESSEPACDECSSGVSHATRRRR